jgi:hypothetical protein
VLQKNAHISGFAECPGPDKILGEKGRPPCGAHHLEWLGLGFRQAGSYRFVRRISTERASVYRTDSFQDVGYPGNNRETFWEIRGAVLEFAGFFQPTTQPTKSTSYMNFRILWQSPQFCMLL